MDHRSEADMKQGIENWKIKLSAKGVFTADNLLELESHLLDELDNLADSGLSPEEQFLIAEKRIGNPKVLSSEYGKVNQFRYLLQKATPYLSGVLMYLFFLSLSKILVLSTIHFLKPSTANGLNYASISIYTLLFLVLIAGLKFSNKLSFSKYFLRPGNLIFLFLFGKVSEIVLLQVTVMYYGSEMFAYFNLNHTIFQFVLMGMTIILLAVGMMKKRREGRLMISHPASSGS